MGSFKQTIAPKNYAKKEKPHDYVLRHRSQSEPSVLFKNQGYIPYNVLNTLNEENLITFLNFLFEGQIQTEFENRSYYSSYVVAAVQNSSEAGLFVIEPKKIKKKKVSKIGT